MLKYTVLENLRLQGSGLLGFRDLGRSLCLESRALAVFGV